MKKTSFIFTIISLVFIFGCSQQVETSTAPQSTPSGGDGGVEEIVIMEEPETEEEPGIKETSKADVKEFTMTAKRFDFEPSTITVNEGDKVKIKITSTDVEHGFSLPDFNINERLIPDLEVVVEFIADKTGTFTYRCNVPCGSGHGAMKGALIVK